MVPVDPQQAWSAYNDALESNPLLVKSVTASVILGAADLAGQKLEGNKSEIDLARTVRFAFFWFDITSAVESFLLPCP